ncbi:endonuclease/exonuclease/phosphatase family protein [Lacticaseibacillus nasuensis]|uniref:endonuclease/exonuclease/phosphatase family protein n=1 Tax=Lacticaseibacillus nasuensis TaxID=944671 RepID=UPI002245C2C5|nr:endonuclease/exonuclease/phosphatase family protein [Lacticaseibacillus nasuensis]MCX2455070.1 endonuclease/exonuclease/phosphatase family protein [Lacticaseibacillus nasuensis]
MSSIQHAISFSVASYNLSCMSQSEQNREQARVLRNQHIDVMGLQEINYQSKRFSGVPYDSLTLFREAGYLNTVFGEAMPYAGGGYGNAIVTDYPVIEKQTTVYDNGDYGREFRDELRRIYRDFDASNPDAVAARDDMFAKHWGKAVEDRAYQRVVVEIEHTEVAFYNTHLSFEYDDLRLAQMKTVHDAMLADPIPYRVLTGDFNADHNTTDWAVFANEFTLANGLNGIWQDTFTGPDPNVTVRSIDNIIVSPNIFVTDVHRIDTDASDHVPLVATLVLA